jgi:uroporphyrinogen-III decarboxylase
MEASGRRLAARADFRYVDRVPVSFCLVPRFFAPLFGMRYRDLFERVETQYYWQLQFAKYRIESIPEDYCTGPVLHASPYFDNVADPSAFGGEIGWLDDGPPRAIPVIKTVEEMERWPMPEPDSGLWGTAVDWWQRMQDLIKETRVTFNDQEGRVCLAPLETGGLSPHMIAVDLVGQDFYWWMIEYPKACHRFLDRITKAIMRAGETFRRIDPRPRGAYGLAEDSAQVMSPQLFKEFCIPYTSALYDKFGAGMRHGRGMHMCGNSTHLHKILVEDARLTSFDIFGYPVAPKVAADNLGGRMLLWGNINPMLMLQGRKEEVTAAARECLQALAPCGGFMLGDGANVCPGTPIENLAALTEAAEEYGLPPGA